MYKNSCNTFRVEIHERNGRKLFIIIFIYDRREMFNTCFWITHAIKLFLNVHNNPGTNSSRFNLRLSFFVLLSCPRRWADEENSFRSEPLGWLVPWSTVSTPNRISINMDLLRKNLVRERIENRTSTLVYGVFLKRVFSGRVGDRRIFLYRLDLIGIRK